MLRAVTGWSIRRPVVVIGLWLALVTAGFTIGVGVFERLVSDVGAVPGSESDWARSLLSQAEPEPLSLVAVVHGRPATDSAVRAATDAAVADVRRLPGVAGVSDPVPSQATGQALLLRVSLHPGEGAEPAADAAAQRLRRIDSARGDRWPAGR
jgi:uncharacterized membrane protein YdfJ with MMPL/SSD domain